MSEAGSRGMRPSTLFSGDSSPEAQSRRRRVVLAFALGFFLVSPLTVLTIWFAWALFSWGRISWKVVAFVALLSLSITAITGTIVKVSKLYLESWIELGSSLIDEPSIATLLSGLPAFFLRQLPGSLVLGLVLGSLYCGWAWYRRPVWEQVKFRPTPWQWYRRRSHVSNIRQGLKGPLHGSTLGVTDYGKKIVQTDDEGSAHTLVVGASGVGKTTTMMLEARDIIARGHALVFVDLKGGQDVPAILADYAERYDRKFVHWLMHNPREEYTGPATSGPAYYDPLGRGDSTRRKDLIIEGRSWSEDYYKILASSYLQTAFEVSIAVPANNDIDAFSDIISLLEPDNLKARALNLPLDSYYNSVREDVDRWVGGKKLSDGERNAISGVRDELQTIRSSVAGRWLRRDPNNDNDINLKRVADEGTIVVFSLDASNYGGLSKLIANLIIQDLKTVTSELRRAPSRNPLHVFIDEFSSADSDNIIGLINKARDAKVPVTLSTQALADLKKVDEAFLDQLLGIINCFIIHRANQDTDAEVYAGLTGKEKRWKIRYGVEHSSGLLGGMGRGSGTGEGHVEEEEDFRVSPSEIQDLMKGQIIYLAKSPKLVIERVTVIPEDGKLGQSDGNNNVRLNSANATFQRPTQENAEILDSPPSIPTARKVMLSTSSEPQEEDSLPSEKETITPRNADPDRLRAIFGDKNAPNPQALQSPTPSAKRPSLPAPITRPLRPSGLPTAPPRPTVPSPSKLPVPAKTPAIKTPTITTPKAPKQNPIASNPKVAPKATITKPKSTPDPLWEEENDQDKDPYGW